MKSIAKIIVEPLPIIFEDSQRSSEIWEDWKRAQATIKREGGGGREKRERHREREPRELQASQSNIDIWKYIGTYHSDTCCKLLEDKKLIRKSQQIYQEKCVSNQLVSHLWLHDGPCRWGEEEEQANLIWYILNLGFWHPDIFIRQINRI